jgi:hypothetical protein
MSKEIEDLLFHLASSIGWFMMGWLTNDVLTKTIEVLTK